MLKITSLVGKYKDFTAVILKRNIGMMPTVYQKASDPIQQLFLDKIREYKQKSAGGKMVDATPEVEKEHQRELDKLARSYGGSQAEMNTFPKFKYEDPPLDEVN